jgi:cold shock CspA family protein
MQATVRHFDAGTRSGSVLLDDGTELPFDTEAFDAGGLRLLRLGQRVNIALEGGEGGEGEADGGRGPGRITAITLSTFPLP